NADKQRRDLSVFICVHLWLKMPFWKVPRRPSAVKRKRLDFGRTTLVFLAVPALVAQDDGLGAKRVNASGKVIDSVTGRPVPNLHLHLQCSTRYGLGGSYDADGDEQGVFTFVGVPDNVCSVNIDGQRLSSDYRYHFNGSEEETTWIIRLIPEVAISGTVLDEKGLPLERALVFLGRSSWSVGGRLPPFSENAYTDARGRFRFDVAQEPDMFRVDEDLYRICAEYSNPGTEQRAAYPLTCFPGVSDWKTAEWVELHPGQSRDFTLRLTPVPGGAVSVTGPPPTGDLRISSVSIWRVGDPEFSSSAPLHTMVRFDSETSAFRLAGLAPGRYRIYTESLATGAPLTGVGEVEVRSEQVTNVALLLTSDPVLRGRVRTDDGSPLEKGVYRGLSLGVDRLIPVSIPDDGLFQVTLGKLGLYRLTFDLPSPWHVVSAKQRDRDALVEGVEVGAAGDPLEPLDVVISRAVGTLGISVAHKEGVQARILLLHRVGTRLEDLSYILPSTMAQVDEPAGFEWRRIPPGAYLVLAMPVKWTPPYSVPYLDKDFLNQHGEFIQEVQVRESSTTRVQLRALDLQ
ncbi:MAG TPA: carboxypeptidase-like regulatory domain-containing protein, partial [Bryobacteraceae bacterium]|nr:carboxypeptidase-like regulatory domain-containing protein [Bryobacteraceae bacterium]